MVNDKTVAYWKNIKIQVDGHHDLGSGRSTMGLLNKKSQISKKASNHIFERDVYTNHPFRSGIFVYATLVPAILIWRQKSFRDEFLSIFKDARTMATELTTYNVWVDLSPNGVMR